MPASFKPGDKVVYHRNDPFWSNIVMKVTDVKDFVNSWGEACYGVAWEGIKYCFAESELTLAQHA